MHSWDMNGDVDVMGYVCNELESEPGWCTQFWWEWSIHFYRDSMSFPRTGMTTNHLLYIAVPCFDPGTIWFCMVLSLNWVLHSFIKGEISSEKVRDFSSCSKSKDKMALSNMSIDMAVYDQPSCVGDGFVLRRELWWPTRRDVVV